MIPNAVQPLRRAGPGSLDESRLGSGGLGWPMTRVWDAEWHAASRRYPWHPHGIGPRTSLETSDTTGRIRTTFRFLSGTLRLAKCCWFCGSWQLPVLAPPSGCPAVVDLVVAMLRSVSCVGAHGASHRSSTCQARHFVVCIAAAPGCGSS